MQQVPLQEINLDQEPSHEVPVQMSQPTYFSALGLRQDTGRQAPHLHHNRQSTHIILRTTFVLLAVPHRAFRMIKWANGCTPVKPTLTASSRHPPPVQRRPQSEHSFDFPAAALLCAAAEASTAASSVASRTPPNSKTLPQFLTIQGPGHPAGPWPPQQTPAASTTSRRGSTPKCSPVPSAEPPTVSTLYHWRRSQVMQEMHNLHPYSAPPTHIAVEAPPLNLTEEDFDAVLENLGVGKAPGLTGWNYEHIKQLCSRRAGKQASLALVNALLSGQLPPVIELLDCDGLPLRKPAGGIRPIAIGEAWIRLASLCAVHKCSDLGPSLVPLHLGVGIPGGAEGVGHAVRSALASDPEALLLSLVWRNAFNTVSRATIFQAVGTNAPSVMPFLRWAYGGPSRIFVRGASNNTDPIYATFVVKQGDPLGPFYLPSPLWGPCAPLLRRTPKRMSLPISMTLMWWDPQTPRSAPSTASPLKCCICGAHSCAHQMLNLVLEEVLHTVVGTYGRACDNHTLFLVRNAQL
jgi:hypothetical protein